jgi:hypothetical protein
MKDARAIVEKLERQRRGDVPSPWPTWFVLSAGAILMLSGANTLLAAFREPRSWGLKNLPDSISWYYPFLFAGFVEIVTGSLCLFGKKRTLNCGLIALLSVGYVVLWYIDWPNPWVFGAGVKELWNISPPLADDAMVAVILYLLGGSTILLRNILAAQWAKSSQWIRSLPAGLSIAILVVVFVGGRYLWICAGRPSHRQIEIASAISSVGTFYGNPQPDHAGNHIAFVRTGERGYGIYLANTATGKKTNLREKVGLDWWGEKLNLRAWSWSPDDSSFVYTEGQEIVVVDSQTSKRAAKIEASNDLSALTWLTPVKFVGLESDKLYLFDKLRNGTWSQNALADHLATTFALRSANGMGAASSSASGMGPEYAFDQNDTTEWSSGDNMFPAWLQYQFIGPAWIITEYRLVSSKKIPNSGPRNWQLLGSNDGNSWTKLDERTNESFRSLSQTNNYSFTNQTPYQYYRLNITAGVFGRADARLAEFQLCSVETPAGGSASVINDYAQGAEQAFDGSIHSKWCNWTDQTGWLQYQFGGGAAWPISQYALTCAEDLPIRDPKDWQFQGSNNGTNWTTLDTRTNETFTERLQTKSYVFVNFRPYCFYRLNITANHGNGGLQLAELNLGVKALQAHPAEDGFFPRSAGGIATASNAAREAGPERAFDESKTTYWFSTNTAGPAWLQYQFIRPAWAITQYRLVSSWEDADADPRDWQLLGSNDATNWMTLDVRTNESFSSRSQTNRYLFTNQTPFQFYRLNVTATAGSRNSVRLAKFQLWSLDTPPEVTASEENGSEESAAKAFDGQIDTKWFNAFKASTGWLQYQFGGGAAWRVSQYSLTAANDGPGRDPKDWQFQASNDGYTWTNLDTRTDEKFTSRLQTKSYFFANTAAYRFYRLNIITNHGEEIGLQLSELNFGPNVALTNRGFDAAPPLPTNSVTFPWELSDALPDAFPNAFSLTTINSNTIVWGQKNRIWSWCVDSNAPALLLDLRKTAPSNTVLRHFSYSPKTGHFLLSCNQNGIDSLWRFAPNAAPVDRLRVLATNAPDGEAAAFESADQSGWIARRNNDLFIGADDASKPEKAASFVYANGFSVTADGQRFFVVGTITNEPAPSLWEYDRSTEKLRVVVPYAEYPSRYAKSLNYESRSLRLPSGRTLNYAIVKPASLARHPHRKYPLLIGDSDFDRFGGVLPSVHGGRWTSALAECDVFVIVVARNNWTDGLPEWSDDVMTVYKRVAENWPIDKDRVFLFGTSGETQYLSDLTAHSPALWRGAILLNPSLLPVFSDTRSSQHRPRILISAGSNEARDDEFKEYQTNSIKSGVIVDILIAPDEGHGFIGNKSELERTRAMMHLICGQ